MATNVEIKSGLDITAGPETHRDLAIIKALGCRPWMPFQPSTDLNAAFAAAEKAGVFSGEYGLFQDTPTQWSVCDARAFSDAFLTQGPTPALAICAAILKLKGNKDGD